MELSRSDQRLLMSKRQERQICWAGFDGFGAEDPESDVQPCSIRSQNQSFVQAWPHGLDWPIPAGPLLASALGEQTISSIISGNESGSGFPLV
jgi:hypothetical protein